MVVVSSAVVADRGAHILRHLGDLAADLLDGFILPFRIFFQRPIQIVDVGGMVLVVVQLHGLLVDCGFQGIISVGKRRQFKGHKRFLSNVCSKRLFLWMPGAYQTMRGSMSGSAQKLPTD